MNMMEAEINGSSEMNMAAEGNGSEQEMTKKQWEIDTSQVPQIPTHFI